MKKLIFALIILVFLASPYLAQAYYDPVAGQWLSFDPMPNDVDPNGQSYCGGDPVNYVDPSGLMGKGANGSAANLLQGVGSLLENTYFSMSYGLTALTYGTRQADQWYGANWQGLRNAVGGTAQTTYDVAAAGTYAILYPFNKNFAYQNYGGSLQRLGMVGTSLSGGANNSGMYRAGYTTFSLASLFVGGGASQMERVSMAGNRALLLPATDASLIGKTTLGYTTPQGNIFLQPGLSRAQQAYVLEHEGVHVFFTPQGSGALATFRQNLGQFGYDNSAFLNASEEIIAETRASGSIFQGIGHAFNGAYAVRGGVVVTPWNFFGEGAAGVGTIGGLGVGSYYIGNNLFGNHQ